MDVAPLRVGVKIIRMDLSKSIGMTVLSSKPQARSVHGAYLRDADGNKLGGFCGLNDK